MTERISLALATMVAMTAGAGMAGASRPITVRSDDRRYAPVRAPRNEPDNRGQRTEKDEIALAKAEAKRQRKAAKRGAAKAGGGWTASKCAQ